MNNKQQKKRLKRLHRIQALRRSHILIEDYLYKHGKITETEWRTSKRLFNTYFEERARMSELEIDEEGIDTMLTRWTNNWNTVQRKESEDAHA